MDLTIYPSRFDSSHSISKSLNPDSLAVKVASVLQIAMCLYITVATPTPYTKNLKLIVAKTIKFIIKYLLKLMIFQFLEYQYR